MNVYRKCIVALFVCVSVSLPVQAFALCSNCGTPVPEPDTVWLMVLGGAMAGIVSYFVKRNKK